MHSASMLCHAMRCYSNAIPIHFHAMLSHTAELHAIAKQLRLSDVYNCSPLLAIVGAQIATELG